MKNYLLSKYLSNFLGKAVLFFLLSIIFLFISFTKSYSEENIFTINNIKVKGKIDLSFTRDKYLNKAFINSFEVLMFKILLTRDLEKIKDIKLNEIKNLISSFQILEESYRKDEYTVKIKIYYDDNKVKKFLGKKNISFSQTTNISAVFFPVLFINGEIQNFNENFFYKNWKNVKTKNELINYILALEDLENISKVVEMKNRIDELNIDDLVNKYDIKNFVFLLMDYHGIELNTYLKTSFENNETSKNFSYKISNFNDEIKLEQILKNLKLKVTDLWKEENLVNLSMPLFIRIKFQHMNLKYLNELKNAFNKISVIDNYTLEEFNINNSFFKIYYYGNPKKLKSELLKFGFQLNGDQGFWQLYLNE